MRLVEHTNYLRAQLESSFSNPTIGLVRPVSIIIPGQESREDIESFGPPTQATHDVWITLAEDRYREMQKALLSLPRLAKNFDPKKALELVKLAYSIRKSFTFQEFLVQNRTSAGCKDLRAMEKIQFQLGRIWRFYRAIISVTNVILGLQWMGKSIEVLDVPSAKVQIHEIKARTSSQVLHERSWLRNLFTNTKTGRLQQFLERWKKYHVHVEVQLITFYAQNPDIRLHSGFIGCNKLACYLCDHFVRQLNTFAVGGCHQRLYSIWTVPEDICFRDQLAAKSIATALQAISWDIETKVRGLGQPEKRHAGLSTLLSDSVAHLSRISLATTNLPAPPVREEHQHVSNIETAIVETNVNRPDVLDQEESCAEEENDSVEETEEEADSEDTDFHEQVLEPTEEPLANDLPPTISRIIPRYLFIHTPPPVHRPLRSSVSAPPLLQRGATPNRHAPLPTTTPVPVPLPAAETSRIHTQSRPRRRRRRRTSHMPRKFTVRPTRPRRVSWASRLLHSIGCGLCVDVEYEGGNGRGNGVRREGKSAAVWSGLVRWTRGWWT